MLEKHILEMLSFRINFVSPYNLIMDIVTLLNATDLRSDATINAYLCLFCECFFLVHINMNHNFSLML